MAAKRGAGPGKGAKKQDKGKKKDVGKKLSRVGAPKARGTGSQALGGKGGHPDLPKGHTPATLQGIATARELFWQNVIREMLTSLSALSASRAERGQEELEGTAAGVAADGAMTASGRMEEMFDGRLGIITTSGQRIPVGAVHPVFGCGVMRSDADKMLSMAVECTVFQVHTPGGEVFTLPLSEIRSFHALTEQLVEKLQATAKKSSEVAEEKESTEPFGFAAYTSLARTRLPSEELPPFAPNEDAEAAD